MEEDEVIKQFCEIRNFMLSSIPEKLQMTLLLNFDHEIRNKIITETVNLIMEEICEKFPDFPEDKIPECRIMLTDQYGVQISIQMYYNPQYDLTYLGTSELSSEVFDCYYKKSSYLDYKYLFVARIGHGNGQTIEGSKDAEKEYRSGIYSQLSVTYGLAYEQGLLV